MYTWFLDVNYHLSSNWYISQKLYYCEFESPAWSYFHQVHAVCAAGIYLLSLGYDCRMPNSEIEKYFCGSVA